MATTSVDIKGRETVSAASASAKAGLEKLKSAAEAANLAFKGFIGLEVVKMLRDVAAFGVDNAKMWAEQERSLIAYNTAVGNARQLTGGANERLAQFAQSMAAATGSSRDTVLQLETFLATSGRTEDQIRRIVEVASDMSVATGRDLNSSVEQLNKTFGGLAGEMGESIPEIRSMTAEQLRHGGAVDLLAQRYAGLSDSLRGTADVGIKNLANSWTDLRGALGSSTTTIFDPMIKGLAGLFEGWAGNLKKAQDYKKALEDIDSIDKVRAARARVTVASTDLEQMYRGKDDASNVMRLNSYLGWKSFNQNLGKKDTSFEAYQKARDDGLREWNEKIAQQIAYMKTLNDDLAKIESGKKPALPISVGGIGGGAPGSTGEKFGPNWNGYGLPSSWDTHDFFPSSLTNSDRARVGRGMGIAAFGSSNYQQAAIASGYRGAMIEEAPAGSWKALGQTAQGGFNVGGAGGAIADLLGSIGNVLGGGLTTVLGPLQAALGPMAIAATLLGKVFEGMMNVLGPSIDSILTPIFNVLGKVGEIIGGALAPVFNALAQTILPIVMFNLKVLATVIEIAMAPLRFMGDLFTWVGKILQDFAWNITHWFDHKDTAGSFSSDAFTGLDERIAAIWADNFTSQDTSYASKTSGSSLNGAGASYQQQRDITVNNYIYTPALVGSDGFREFCILVSREMKSAGVLGLA